MVARVLLWAVLLPNLGWADAGVERGWIAARNATAPGEPYPAGFELSPESAVPPAADPAWTFWTDAWDVAARDWTRGLYVALKLTREGQLAAADNEVPHLARVLARVNLAAAHANAERVRIQSAVDHLVLAGLREAARAAGVARGLAQPQYLELVGRVADLVRGDEALGAVTRDLERRWKHHDVHAHLARERQSILAAALAGAVTWQTALPLGYQASLCASAAVFGVATLTGITLARSPFPISFRRFHWRENFVREPVAKCEALLVNERVCGH